MAPERIVLVGARGAGKTAVGRRLAARLGLPFADADAEVEKETGRTAGALLRAGELRDVEAAVLPRLLAARRGVLASGGGAVLWHGFRRAARGWVVVWLDASATELARRIESGGDARPPLTGGSSSASEEAGAVRDARAALYRAAAAHRVDTTSRAADDVSCELARLLSRRGDPESPRAD